MKDNNTAIKIDNVSKTFQVPQEKRNALKSYFINPFRKTYKQIFHALDKVDVEIHKGEFVGLIGSNGSGKSTLLKIIAGIYSPDKGKVKTYGKLVPFLELGVGFNPELSGRENIFLNGTILGMKRKFLEKQFDEIVNFAELQEFIDLPLKNYSSGMQVRLAFAIAIQAEADIYLLDEILSVGDSAFREKSLSAMQKLKKENKTIVYVSHDLNSVQEYSDRVILMEHGKMVLIGPPENVILKYNSLVMKGQNAAGEKPTKKEASVESVDFYVNGVKSKDFIAKHGDDIEFHLNIKYDNNVALKDLKGSLGIYNIDENYIFGVNTSMSKYKIKTGSKKLVLKMYDINLLNGKYYINAALFNDNENLPIEFLGKALYFKVIASPEYRGAVSLKHEWKAE